METFGEYLRSQREKKGIRLEEIASITKIHLHSLQFLERGNWGDLPPEPFIRGFIIAYAKYVGLDPKDVMERYALEHGKSSPHTFDLGVVSSANTSPSAQPVSTENESPDQVLNSPRTLPIRKLAFGFIGFLILLTIGILVSLGKQHERPSVAEIKQVAPPPTEQRTVTSETTVPAPLKTEEVKPSPPEITHEISLETRERSWAKIVIDDKAPVEFYTIPEKKISYQAKEKLKLVLGNAVGAKVEHNGQVTEGRKVLGTIRYYIFPEGARFAQDVPKRKAASEQEATAPGLAPENSQTQD